MLSIKLALHLHLASPPATLVKDFGKHIRMREQFLMRERFLMRVITGAHPNRQRHWECIIFEGNNPQKMIAKGTCGVSITRKQAWHPPQRRNNIQPWAGGEVSTPCLGEGEAR